MSYERQTFIDRVVDNSGKVVTEGTKLKATHLQHIEDGILEVENTAQTAQSIANTAGNNANSARSMASSAMSAASEAKAAASTASSTAASAKASATTALDTANEASDRADRAYSTASTAYASADNAASVANSARATADNAASAASNAFAAASNALTTANKKQDQLVSGTNIKTINGKPVVGEGNLEILNIPESLYDQAKKQITRFRHQCVKAIDPPAEKEVDIILFSGQSNSCGRAQLADCSTPEDLLLSTPLKKAFHFNNLASTQPLEIVEPITANGTSTYGYIPAFLNAYHATTGRQVCACFMSVGGANLNKFVPYVLDANSQPTNKANSYFTSMVDRVNHAKVQLSLLGYTVGGVYLVWCQGENDAYYYGTDTGSYCTDYEKTLTTSDAKTKYYKGLFMTLVDGLKTEIGLDATFIIRIGHRKENPTRWEMYGPIVQAQNELGMEQDSCVLVSTIFAGAEKFIEEDGSVRNLMRDYTHYKPEGYVRAGLEAGVNAGLYVNSGRKVKPILLEYERLLFADDMVYERPVDAYLYDPCRVDLNLMKKFAADVVTSIGLTFTQTSLGVGDTAQIVATVYPTTVSNKTVLFQSSAPDIVTVSNTGLITAKAEGSAVITVTSESTSNISATVEVTVAKAVVPVQSITLNHTTASLLVGQTLQLTATLTPDDATDKTVIWTSSDPGAASVDENGLVTALEQGDATITAVPSGNSALSANCVISLAHNTATVLLDLDFTQKTVAEYIDAGVLSIDDSTIASLAYGDNGLECNDTDLTYGLKLTEPIDVNQNWCVETTLTIPEFANSGSTATEAVYPHLSLLSSTSDHATHGNACLAPCVLDNKYVASIRLAEGISTSTGVNGVFLHDGKEHSYKMTYNAETRVFEAFRDEVSIGTKTWPGETAPVSGAFGYVLGIHKGYSYSANFRPKAGFKIRSLKVSKT